MSYMKGDLLVLKHFKVQKVSKPILAALHKMFDANNESNEDGDNWRKNLPVETDDVVGVSDFYGSVAIMITKLRKKGKKPLWFDMSLSGFEELFIFSGSEKSILKTIAAETERLKKE